MAEVVRRLWSESGGLRSGLFAILVVQALFWLVYYPQVVERPAMPQPIAAAQDISEGKLDSPTYAALASAHLQPVEQLPFEICCEPGYRALRFYLDLPQVPDRGLVMVPGFGADNHFLYVNGQFSDGRGRLELPDNTYHHNDFRMIRINPGELSPGRNEFVAIVVRNTGTGFDYLPPTLFDAREFKAPHLRREFVLGTFAWMQIAMSLLVTLFAFFLFVRSRDRAVPFWLFLVAACWMQQLFFYKWADPPFSGDVRLAYIQTLYLSMAYACFGWADAWTVRRLRWTLPAATILFTVFLGLIWWASLVAPVDQQFNLSNFSAGLSGFLLSVAAIIRLAWGSYDVDERRAWELAFALPLPIGLAFDMYGELTDQARWGIAEISQPLLITGLLAAFFARNIRLFRSQEQINALLQTQLTERTAELEAAHARETELVRKQAHQNERQRIMRDMHDGLGSQLMSMLLAARRGVAKPAAVAEGLQTVIDEMRLLIDSMDSVGESLGSAFAIFRERVQPRIEAAGMRFVWQDETAGDLPDYGPRDVLQVFRIMQEAVTNALKHSGGTVLTVSLSPSPDQAFALRLTIADNGKGMGQGNPRGKGLDSMASRANGIGGRLDFASSKVGVAVVLDLLGSRENAVMP